MVGVGRMRKPVPGLPSSYASSLFRPHGGQLVRVLLPPPTQAVLGSHRLPGRNSDSVLLAKLTDGLEGRGEWTQCKHCPPTTSPHLHKKDVPSFQPLRRTGGHPCLAGARLTLQGNRTAEATFSIARFLMLGVRAPLHVGQQLNFWRHWLHTRCPAWHCRMGGRT